MLTVDLPKLRFVTWHKFNNWNNVLQFFLWQILILVVLKDIKASIILLLKLSSNNHFNLCICFEYIINKPIYEHILHSNNLAILCL